MDERNEPELESCHTCGKQILKGAYICDACAHVIDCEQLDAMEQNEPSTAEIVEEYKRVTSDAWRACEGCDLKALLRQSISRLEQLERDNAELRANEQAMMPLVANYPALKSRAEKAEAERDAAIADIGKFAHTSHTCAHNESGLCALAADDHGFCDRCPAWGWRGLRGKGNDGKSN